MRHFYVRLVLGVVFTNDKTDRSSPTAGGGRDHSVPDWYRDTFSVNYDCP